MAQRSLTKATLSTEAWVTAAIPAPVRYLLIATGPAVVFALTESRQWPALGYILAIALGLLLAGFAGAVLALVESYVFLLVYIVNHSSAASTIAQAVLLTLTCAVVGGGLLVLERSRAEAAEDATRLRAALGSLSEKTGLLNRASELGGVGTWVWDAATNRSEWSEATWRMYGLSAEDAEDGDPGLFWALVHPDERARVEQGFVAAFANGAGFEAEHRIVRPDGEVRWLRTRGEVELDASGTPVRQLGVVIDVSESKRVEAELRQKTRSLEDARDVLRRAQEIGKLGSFVADLSSDTIDWSRELARLFGAGDEAFTSARNGYWDYIHPEDRERVIEQVAVMLVRDERLELEYRAVRPDGPVIWVQVHASIDRDPSGAARRLVGIVQDITAQRALEEQFRQTQKLEAVGQLAGGIAHDFNNLLTVIAGNAELALRSATTPAVAERLAEIMRSSERAGELVRQLLAFSRADAIEPRVVDLNEAVGGVRRMLARLLPENIEVDARLHPTATPVLVDPGQLEQVLLNLAVNARDAMSGGGRLTIGSSADADTVTLCVSDTGIGMDARTLERIFDPFYTTKPTGQGTGLGLSTVYGIVSKAGGEIEVESAPGDGTTFTITLPRAPTNGRVEAPPAPGPLVGGNGERVLIVEDEPMLLALTAELLGRAGYITVSVENGEAALLAIDEHEPFDLIVTDLMMPGLTGTELTAELRARGHQAPVIYTSGYAEGVLALAEFDERSLLVVKPFSGQEITAAARTLLDRTRTSA